MTEKLNSYMCWVGVACSLSSYLLLNLQVIAASSAAFIALNIAACLFIGYSAFCKKLNAVVAQNAIWLSITLVGAYRALH